MNKPKKELTLLMPAYNEQNLLTSAVEYYYSYLKKLKIPFEIIICVNGSTDKTEDVARELSKKHKEVKYLATKKKGMGIAMKFGMLNASKEIITYMPGDGEISADFIGAALPLMVKYDLVIGTRKKSPYEGKSILRKILSWGFNLLLSILLSSKVAEAASVKMFRKDWAKKSAKELENHGFDWQVEFVYYALRDKLKIASAPSRVLGKKKKSSVNPLKVTWKLLKASLKYGWHYRIEQIKKFSNRSLTSRN